MSDGGETPVGMSGSHTIVRDWSRMTGYTEITRLVARHKMFFGSSKSVRCGLPTTREVSHRGSNLVLGAFYGIMRTNCPDLPGQLQSRGGLPPETHGNPWPEAQR
jgi:hypothetical protein